MPERAQPTMNTYGLTTRASGTSIRATLLPFVCGNALWLGVARAAQGLCVGRAKPFKNCVIGDASKQGAVDTAKDIIKIHVNLPADLEPSNFVRILHYVLISEACRTFAQFAGDCLAMRKSTGWPKIGPSETCRGAEFSPRSVNRRLHVQLA